jgi:hypothetical protein
MDLNLKNMHEMNHSMLKDSRKNESSYENILFNSHKIIFYKKPENDIVILLLI